MCPLSSRKRSFLISSPRFNWLKRRFFWRRFGLLSKFFDLFVAYVNHHNKDSLRITSCDWLCGGDAAFVKLLWPLVELSVDHAQNRPFLLLLHIVLRLLDLLLLHPKILYIVQEVKVIWQKPHHRRKANRKEFSWDSLCCDDSCIPVSYTHLTLPTKRIV